MFEGNSLHDKSVGFALSKKFCINNEIKDLCYQKQIDFGCVYDEQSEVFRLYLFSFEEAFQVICYIRRRNLNALFVNFYED